MQKIIEKSLSKKTEKSTKEVEQILLKKLNQETQKIDFSKVWDAQTFHLNHHKDLLRTGFEKPTI